MVGAILKKCKRIKNLKNNWQPSYLRYGCLPIEEKTVLLEGGQGSQINGNMFALVKELCQNPAWQDYSVVFVVTKETLVAAKARFSFYGFTKVRFVVRNGKEYCKALATAKYLFTDNTFPPYFHKREEQVYCNTWHGTPLKTLGYANKETLFSVNNIQKNYMAADYALFPNEFTRQVFMKDYALEHIFPGKSIVANYPRNNVFYNPQQGVAMKQKLGFQGKKLYAYMPTFREAKSEKEKQKELETIRTFLREWDSLLPDDSHLLLNLHFVLASGLNCDEFKRVSYFPKEYETYEVLNACDGLVTDYSSVFFDFAVTQKPVVLFAYDKEKYLANRGVYFPLERLPFPVVSTVQEVVQALEQPRETPKGFLNTFCGNGSENCAHQLLETVLGKEEHFVVSGEEHPPLALVYAHGVSAEIDGLIHTLSHDTTHHFVVVYRKKITQALLELPALFPGRVTLLGLTNAFQFTLWQRFLLMWEGKKPFSALSGFYKRETQRLFGKITPQKVIDFTGDNLVVSTLLSHLSGEKFTVQHSEFLPCRFKDKVKKREQALGFSWLDQTQFETRWLQENPEVLQTLLRKRTSFIPILPLYLNLGKKMVCLSFFKCKTKANVSVKNMKVTLGENTYSFGCLCGKKPKTVHRGLCWFSVPLQDALTLPAKNQVFLTYEHPLGEQVSIAMKYCAMPLNKFLGLRGPMAVDKDTKTVAVYRQTIHNKLIVYVRSVNVTDRISMRLKQTLAFGLGLLWHTKKAKELILLFEKNGEKYEESASVLYEELINQGYRNAYFLITKDSPYLHRVAEEYRKNLVYKYSFRHFLYFFKTKTFIGTEAVVHAIDLKTFNVLALKKTADKSMNYVFLQHGVMYMVSLDSQSRRMFARKKLKGKYRVVVSSQAEADHFTQLGRHLPEDLYITGLPKFDRNRYSETADKIVIMPTWRPWEINQARGDFAATGYCRMMLSLYQNIPLPLQEKTVILPHPLVREELNKLPKEVTEKMVLDVPYDEILKHTAVLITDYSSIAYDAFYRGARVIFDWTEKDACMEAYGPSTKLMLHEGNVFGDVLYSHDSLPELLAETYAMPQKEEYKNRYAELVEFHDGNNTKRLISFLKQDGIL